MFVCPSYLLSFPVMHVVNLVYIVYTFTCYFQIKNNEKKVYYDNFLVTPLYFFETIHNSMTREWSQRWILKKAQNTWGLLWEFVLNYLFENFLEFHDFTSKSVCKFCLFCRLSTRCNQRGKRRLNSRGI